MDLYAATQAFNEAAAKAWTSCDTVDIPGCPGWAFNGPARPTDEFFVAISYDGREIARAYGDEADPMWIIKMIRRGFLLSLDSEFNYWLANCDCSSYHWDFDPGIGVTAPAKA